MLQSWMPKSDELFFSYDGSLLDIKATNWLEIVGWALNLMRQSISELPLRKNSAFMLCPLKLSVRDDSL